jgi:hypothetical protein
MNFYTALIWKVGTRLMFGFTWHAVCAALRSAHPRRSTIANFNLSLLTDQFLVDCLARVMDEYQGAGGDDVAAKGSEVLSFLEHDLEKRFARVKPWEAKAYEGQKDS